MEIGSFDFQGLGQLSNLDSSISSGFQSLQNLYPKSTTGNALLAGLGSLLCGC